MCSGKYCTQHWGGLNWAQRYFQAEVAPFTQVTLTISLTIPDIVSNAPGRRLKTNRKFSEMKMVISELAHVLARRQGLTDLRVAVNVHFEERLFNAEMEEALGLDITELLQDEHMKELIGRSACWLLGPFEQIHNLEKAEYKVGITGLKKPPNITWNDGLIKFLAAVTMQSTARRSSRRKGDSAARPDEQEPEEPEELYVSDFTE
ncbi:hypothetical protein FKW77_010031 [Venturia effusa]|uniref:Uncharacterized protein n=1 Tax=Venturia effusa TaxID=50376 RepID=A0A517LA30_9PEZI|nr:hypothetical protein FKW77_010031 [Venturia effusa]